PDRRVGLRAGEMNAGEATWNLRVVSKTRPSEKFAGVTNSDLSFSGHYVIQGNYNGYQVWDMMNPKKPRLKIGFLCPASQSDVSGSAGVRSPNELPGCSTLAPDQDPNSALFRIEIIKVPLAHPELASIVSSPRIFNDLTEAATHAEAPEDIAAAAKAAAEARAQGGFTATIRGIERVAPSGFIQPLLDSIVKARQGTGAPTGADSAALRGALQRIVDALVGGPPPGMRNGVR